MIIILNYNFYFHLELKFIDLNKFKQFTLIGEDLID